MFSSKLSADGDRNDVFWDGLSTAIVKRQELFINFTVVFSTVVRIVTTANRTILFRMKHSTRYVSAQDVPRNYFNNTGTPLWRCGNAILNMRAV